MQIARTDFLNGRALITVPGFRRANVLLQFIGEDGRKKTIRMPPLEVLLHHYGLTEATKALPEDDPNYCR